jgi:copper chaperone
MVQLKVTGMTCNGCANSVKRAVGRVLPGAIVEVKLESGIVRIEGTTDAALAISAIASAGYGVEALPA